MVGSQKILTVSYGTFSCTLEGFEDSFETMKAIAEYFRDLAAEDRYFGAEPPVPDAEMLTRIAEREVSRRVEARMEASGIVLRVGSALDAAAAGATAATAAPEEDAGQAADESAAAAPDAAPVAEDLPPAETPAETLAETPAETVSAPVLDPVAKAPADPAMPPAMVAPSNPASARAGFEDLAEETAEEAEPLATPVETVLPAHPDADSVAAKLQRIRAVVGKSALATQAGDSASDAQLEDGEELWSGLGGAQAETAFAAPEMAEDEMAEAGMTDAEQPSQDEEPTDQDHAAPEAAEPAADQALETAEDEVASTDEPQAAEADPAPVRPRVIRIRRADFDAAVAAGTIAMRPDPAPAAEVEAEAEDDGVAEAEAFDAAEASPEPAMTEAEAAPEDVQLEAPEVSEADLVQDLAQDLADLTAEDIADNTAEDMAEDTAEEMIGEAFDLSDEQELNAAQLDEDLEDLARLDGAPALAEPGEASLSAEAEAELLRELAAVETAAEMLAEDSAAVSEEAAFETEEAPEALFEEASDDLSDAPAELSIADLMAKAATSITAPAASDARDDVAEEADDPDLTAALSGLEPDWSDVDDAPRAETEAEAAWQAGEDAEAELGAELGAELEADAVAGAFDEDETTPEAQAEAEAPAEEMAEAPEAADPLVAAGEPVPAGDDAAGIADLPGDDAHRTGREILADGDEDADLDRLMDQTDAELNTPEASRRRDAIAQLRAAVAATEAARRMGEVTKPGAPETTAEAYREDLREVVRPRRPTQPLDPDHRSERPRPAPLKLVASQRVDLPKAAPAEPGLSEPVRPRRVRLEAEDLAEDLATTDSAAAGPAPAAARAEGTFMDFARSMGAVSLSDMLEAAAAYTSYVEGSEDFSRPQILTKVREAKPEDFSREDGLRSFGTLLREGRIVRARPGRFVVNEDTRFNPARQAG